MKTESNNIDRSMGFIIFSASFLVEMLLLYFNNINVGADVLLLFVIYPFAGGMLSVVIRYFWTDQTGLFVAQIATSIACLISLRYCFDNVFVDLYMLSFISVTLLTLSGASFAHHLIYNIIN